MTKKKTAAKATGKATGKGKGKAKGMTASERKTFTKADGVGAGSKAKAGDGAALVTVGVKAGKGKGKTVVSAVEFAAIVGVDAKRLRGWIRDGKQLGNDGRYSHYAIDLASKDGKALLAAAKARFNR